MPTSEWLEWWEFSEWWKDKEKERGCLNVKKLAFEVTVRFHVPADQPLAAAEKLEQFKQLGDVVKVKANAAQKEKGE